MRSFSLGIVVICLMGSALAGEAQTPEPRILQRWAGGAADPLAEGAVFEPSYIPIRLLKMPYGKWSASNQELVPQSFYDDFWAHIQEFDERGEAPACLPPALSETLERGLDSLPKHSLDAVQVAKSLPVAVVGKLTFEEPAWDVRGRRVATLKYFEITQLIKNVTAEPLFVNDVVTVVADYGSVQVGGVNLCSLATRQSIANASDTATRVETKDFLILGHLLSYQEKFLQASSAYIFRIVGSEIYPPPGIEAYANKLMTLNDFLSGLQG